MPIYEYNCRSCGAQASVLYASIAAAPPDAEVACLECGAVGLERLLSRFAVASGGAVPARSESRQGATAGSGEDSRDLARIMRRASSGNDSEFNEVATRLERGEGATSVEKSLRKRVGETLQAH